jgi:hypothetical protein
LNVHTYILTKVRLFWLRSKGKSPVSQLFQNNQNIAGIISLFIFYH